MNIRPIDLQVLIPRVTEVSKTQQVTENQNALQQQQFAEEWRQISTQRQHQVQHAPRAQDGVITDRDPDNGQQRKERRNQSRSKKNAIAAGDNMGNDPDRGNIIDIKT